MTEFEIATAAKLAFERNRETPIDKDLEDAVRMCSKWNKQRKEMGLRLWQ